MFTKSIVLKNLRPISKKDGEIVRLTASVNKWAVEEAFLFVRHHPELSTTDALERFIKLMETYAAKAKTEQSAYIFSAASDMGYDILDYWIQTNNFERREDV